jgi:toxin ParE1/3/4
VKVLFTARALKQIGDIGAYVARENPRASAELLTPIRSACLRLADHPRAGHPTKAPNVRVVTMARDAYRVFYDVHRSDRIRILHVRHAARRPLRRFQ